MNPYDIFEGQALKVACLIRQRRSQLMVHSYLYYELNENIVSDTKWNEWSEELVELQRKYPEISSKVDYYEEFKDWDGSTGAFLQFDDRIKQTANYLLEIADNLKKSKKEELKKKKGALF